MKIIIDRFEGNFAVVELEDKTFENLPKVLIPANAKEGDVIEISINKNETEKRKANMKSLIDEIWKD